MPRSIVDQIKDLENTRAAKFARMTNVMQKSIDEERSLDEEEATEYDGLEIEVKQVDDDLVRLKKLESLKLKDATPLNDNGADPKKSASEHRGGLTVVNKSADKDEKFQGQNYTRIIIAKALARMHDCMPSAIAEKRWGKTNPTLVSLIKANEIAGGGTGSGEWGAELATADGRYTGDFIDFLYSHTVFDKLPLREVPANVTIKGQDGAATGYWVGESKAIPASKPDFMNVTLTYLKVAALAVVSNELLRESSPAAEALVRDALVNASAQRVDTTFLSAAAASAGVSPAGLLNGVTAISSAGNDGDALRADIKALIATFITAKNTGGLYFVTSPGLASAISMMTNALGQFENPNITEEGGTLLGKRVVTGDNVNAAHLILLKPSDIYKIGDRGVEVSISKDATVEQNSVPAGASDTPAASANTLVSMYQTESTAIKVVRPISFAKRRTSAVAYIDDADYGSPAS